jgi:hypothetical protein
VDRLDAAEAHPAAAAADAIHLTERDDEMRQEVAGAMTNGRGISSCVLSASA